MFLFRNDNAGLDFADVNGGDDSGVVWHEYGHGLSNRLITNADGSGAVNSAHAGAMGEAWGDWYASDLQVRDGLKTDTAAAGEIDIGDYTELDNHALRSQAADCPVGASAAICPGTPTAGTGGYTLGDFGNIFFAGPEVHADGELWSETLWDLRQALGSDLDRVRHRRDARDRRDAPVAARAVDARHAQRDPERRPDELRRRQRGRHLGGVPRARDGLLRRRRGRRRHGAGRGLLGDAGRRRAHRHGDGRRHGGRRRAPDRGRGGRVRRPHVGRRAAHGRHRRGRALHDLRPARRHLPEAHVRPDRRLRPRRRDGRRGHRRRYDDARRRPAARLGGRRRRRAGRGRQRQHERRVRLRRRRGVRPVAGHGLVAVQPGQPAPGQPGHAATRR